MFAPIPDGADIITEIIGRIRREILFLVNAIDGFIEPIYSGGLLGFVKRDFFRGLRPEHIEDQFWRVDFVCLVYVEAIQIELTEVIVQLFLTLEFALWLVVYDEDVPGVFVLYD